MTGTKFHADLGIASWLRLLAVVVLAVTGLTAHAAGSALSPADQQCLGCHAMEGMKKVLENGQSLPLHVGAEAFAKSVHARVGCTGCHSQLTMATHPGDAKPIKGLREYAVAQTEMCRGCHERIYRTYQGSMHAVRLRGGNLAAATCADCHKPHQVSPASVQDGPKNACIACHSAPAETHQKWLPNAGRHLEAVACSACHAPDALKKVDLRLIDNATRQRLVDDASVQFAQRARAADANGDGLDAKELRALFAQFNREGDTVSFRGHIELRTGMDAHELSVKESAVRDCQACHHERAAPFQRVSVSALGPDQRPMYYDAHSDVLRSVFTVKALGDFYAIGGTRIRVLDMLVALVLLIGVSAPIVHVGLGWLSRKFAKKIGGREDS